MNLDYLDQMIPKRWVLLLRYWLPFFKTPSPFYFECRSFINTLVHLDHTYFWREFPNLISIFERTTSHETERKLALEIISKIFATETEITQKYLLLFFKKFDPNLKKRTSILNEVLQRIPHTVYIDYFSQLNSANCSFLDLKWCVHLKTKFKLEDRLMLILSLPDKQLSDYKSTISKLLTQELESKWLNEPNRYLTEKANKQLLKFIFTRNPRLIFSDAFIQTLIKQWLETQDPLLTSSLLERDIPERLYFFKHFLVNSENFQPMSQYFFNLCQEDQWSGIVNHLIDSIASTQEAMQNEDRDRHEEKEIPVDDWNFFLLQQLQKGDYLLNLFQFLAIQTLTKEALDLERLKKIFNANSSLQEYKNFSLACQLLVVEYNILGIKKYIKTHYMILIQKESSRQNIHRAFDQFYDNEQVNVTKLILKQLPEDLQACCETDLNFLHALLSQLYLILNDREVVNYKNKRVIDRNKKQSDCEEKYRARRELLRRIHEGTQTRVSYQRMQELFSSEASKIQEEWTQRALGIHFFDANNPDEYKVAEKEAKVAKETIQFNREYNDFSGLSSSPSSVSYFNDR